MTYLNKTSIESSKSHFVFQHRHSHLLINSHSLSVFKTCTTLFLISKQSCDCIVSLKTKIIYGNTFTYYFLICRLRFQIWISRWRERAGSPRGSLRLFQTFYHTECWWNLPLGTSTYHESTSRIIFITKLEVAITGT